MYINGTWRHTGKKIQVKNPATGEVFQEVYTGGSEEAEEAVLSAHQAFSSWSQKTAVDRAKYIEMIVDKIIEKREMLARTITQEMGKSIHNARYEVDSTISFFKWFAEEARRVYGETIPASAVDKRLMVIKQPVGVVAAITPWNFPLSMIARKLAPALAAGCTVVLRPSSQSPISAIELFSIFDECELPPGVVNLVVGGADEISNVLLSHEKVRKISFTGSTEVGKSLIKQAADTMKRVSMELGGHAPFIVFEDANLDEAVDGAIAIKFNSAGQQCVCANRIYIQSSIYDKFSQLFVERTANLKIGNGLDESCQIGPLINNGAIDKVQDQVDDAVSKGATLLYGGGRLSDGEYANGSYYQPTVLANVKEGMKIVHEETFGPVAPLIRFETEEEVITKANNIEYGLASYVYTNDLSRMYRVMERLEYGIVGVNDAAPFAVQAPFGGMKESGVGREGGHGIEDYLETKFVSIKITP
jgi:succinate-semialdehyde dehydrogenase/glutarate-semialdehyde dehydrogenase